MTVYIDILIVLNTLVNYFMLLAVKRMSRSYTPRWRIALGALTGGVSSLLIFAESLGFIMTALKIVTSVVMVIIAFKFVSFKRLFKNILLLFVISFIFGGLVLAAYLLFDTDIMIYQSGIVYFDINMTFLVICSVIAYGAISLLSYFIDKKAPKNKEYYITVQKGERSVSCTALMDTGNNLREPFSGFPVILADKTVFSQLFGGMDDVGVRLIPATTASGSTVLKAYRPDNVSVGETAVNSVYIAESTQPLENYKIVLNINMEEEISDAKAKAVAK